VKRAVVVGAGVFGAGAARELSRRGWRVTVVDRDDPARPGASAAETRIIRISHGARDWYARSALRALAGWRSLERESGRTLLDTCGVLLLAAGNADGVFERESAACLQQLGVPSEVLRPAALARRFPELSTQGLEFALLEPESGVLLARQCTQALLDSALAAGAVKIAGTARPAGDGQLLIDGEHVSADLVVWAVGADLPGLFPQVRRESGIRKVRQDSFQLDLPPCSGQIPAWLDSGQGVYGVPALAEARAKVVPDVETPVGTPLPARPRLPEETAAYLRTRLPAWAASPVITREACCYAETPDEHFLLTPLPGLPRTWIVGGDSGHGFKHGPAWAGYVADALEGRHVPHPRFQFRRQPRPVPPKERQP
jgi:sarcosine oxidase